jgi:hypothetical protein
MGAMAAQHMHWSTSMEISLISDFTYMEFTTHDEGSSFIYVSIEITNKNYRQHFFEIIKSNFLIMRGFAHLDRFTFIFHLVQVLEATHYDSLGGSAHRLE